MGAIQSVVKTFEICATMYIHVPVTLETEIRLNIKSHRLPNTIIYIFYHIHNMKCILFVQCKSLLFLNKFDHILYLL